jgi:hypothetical protein
VIFLHAYYKKSLIKLLAISKNHVLKKFNIHNKKAEKVFEHKFQMRPSKYYVHLCHLFVIYDRIQNGLIEIFNIKTMHRVSQLSPFSEGMLSGIGFPNSHPQLLTSYESPLSQTSGLWSCIYCFDSQGNFTEFDWDHNRVVRNYKFESIVLDCCCNSQGLFIITEELKLYQDIGSSDSSNDQMFNFKKIVDFDSGLIHNKEFTKIRSYLDKFLLMNIGRYFIIYGIQEKNANMIKMENIIKDFQISEVNNQAVLIVGNSSMVIEFYENNIIKKIESSSGLKSLAVLDNFVVVGGFSRKIIHFKLETTYK